MRITATILAATSMTAIAAATPALAQDAPQDPAPSAQAPAAEDEEAIVITGTQIRGIAGPVGSNVISISEREIQATGATNTQQLLATLPQTTSFNNFAATLPGQGVAAGVARVPIARPNIRRLPGCAGSGTGACTLILVDGHRIVPGGMEQIAVDPGIIPPGIIQRVETILDGNSAIYGSDAIGGVINFITRRRYEGVKADARYGIGDSYHSIDANLTGGIDWGSGSFVATYSFGHNDSIFGRDRDYVKSIDWGTGLPSSATQAHLQCDVPNVQAGALLFAAPTLAPGANLCDPSAHSSLYPTNTRHTGYASLSQDFGDSITFDLTGFYSNFRTVSNTGPFTGNVAISGTGATNPQTGAALPVNPFFQNIPSSPGTRTYNVLFSYGPAFGNASGTQQIRIEAWQVTPSLTVDLGGDWQIRALGSYGWSNTASKLHQVDATAQNTARQATTPGEALNPLNIAATNQTVLADINDFFNRQNGVNKFYNTRMIGDGPLFDLPGGAVRASIGVEYMKSKFKRRTTQGQALTPYIEGSVEAKSVFGELYIPVVGEENGMGGIHKLDLSISGRYDHYDQGVGGTFNPKFAVTLEPVDWVTMRGNWGKSFNAPTAADRVGEQIQTVAAVGCGTGTSCNFVPTGTVLAGGRQQFLLFLSGTAPGLKPQTARNWSLGLDLRPPVVPNLQLSLTYYNIRIRDFISLPQIAGNVQQAFLDFPQLVQTFPNGLSATAGAVDPLITAYLLQATSSGPTALATIQTANGVVVQLGPDNRVRNLGVFKVSGLDFTVSYRHEVNFGSLDLRYTGNFQLKRDFAPNAGDPFQNTLFNEGVPDFASSLVLGANVGRARFQATWNHSGKYDFNRTLVPTVLQGSVGGFDSIDLFFRYAFPDNGLTKDLAFTLNINNALDSEPPVYLSTNGAGNGFAPNIRTLGRVVLFGLEKEF